MQLTESDYYAKIALQAARRAARQVIEQAHKDKVSIPIWQDNQIKWRIPELDATWKSNEF